MEGELWQQIFVVAVVITVFTAFVREWFTPDIVAMTALAVLVVSGILSPQSALGVFGNSAPVTIACMFILSAALERTGLIEALADWFRRIAGKTEQSILLAMVLVVAPMSAFVNNTPVVVVFLPIVLKLCRELDLTASRLLIPLSYAAIAGGTCTVIGTSTNLLATGIAESTEGMRPFGMFEPAKLGLVFVVITLVYLLTVGRSLLPDRTTLASLIESEPGREFLTQAMVSKDSPMVGKTIMETPLAKNREVRIIEIVRGGSAVKKALNKVTFAEGDLLLLKSRVSGVKEISETEGLELGSELGLDRVQTESAVLMEGIIGPQSGLVGKTLRDLNFRQRFGVLILAVHRRGENLRERFEDVELAFGDTLLVEGPAEKMNRLFQERDFINLSEPKQTSLRRSKAPIAMGALIAFIGMGAFTEVPTAVLALCAVLVTLLTRCIDTREAYQSVEWSVIFLIFGMLALGEALRVTGTVDLMAGMATNVFGEYGPAVVLSVLYLTAALLTEVLSNNAVAALLTPIALVIGAQMGVDARPFVVAVMFGSSASFSTPIGYQTNTFVFGAGGYRFTDFTRVGAPLAIILWITASLLIPLLWPFEG
ncbi:MAG: SLC13 family permease [Verrucomicrobiota bacterium]